MDLQRVGCRVVDWIDLAQDRDRWRAVVNAVMNLRDPYSVGSFVNSWEPGCFSGRTLLHGIRFLFVRFNKFPAKGGELATPCRCLWWRLQFVGRQYETRYLSLLWRPEIWESGNICGPMFWSLIWSETFYGTCDEKVLQCSLMKPYVETCQVVV